MPFKSGFMPALVCLSWLASGCPDELGADDDDDHAADDDSAAGDDDDSVTDDDDSAADDDDDVTPPDQDVYVWPPLDFGDVVLGCEEAAEVQIVNVGEEPTTVLATALDMDDGHFTLVPPVEWPLTIYPGFDLGLDVIYHPQTVGGHEATILVETDHPDLPQVGGSTVGSGLSAGQHTDTFVQEDTTTVDILWVVDNSCSMWEEQAALAANAEDFLDYLDAAGLDYQVGVVTTDSPSMGSPIITPATADAAAAFADAVSLGTSGSGTEQPLLQAHSGLTPPQTDPGGANEGFVRDGAGLSVIILTDEDDQSGGTAAAWAAEFQALKPDSALVAVSGITGMISGCATAYGTPILSEVVALTGGLEVSICGEDWSPVLSVAAELVAGPNTRFQLTQAPMPQTLVVTVDGVQVDEGWSYEEVDNAVVFDEPPDDGAALEMTYELVGDCSEEEEE